MHKQLGSYTVLIASWLKVKNNITLFFYGNNMTKLSVNLSTKFTMIPECKDEDHIFAPKKNKRKTFVE